jgi:uncharacterized protein (TIGR02284 family)
MNTSNQQSKTIQELVRINFERMISFDKASRITKDSDLKTYFEKKAEESERNIDELQQVALSEKSMVNDNQSATYLPACQVFDRALAKNKADQIIHSARRVEKHMMEWYQKVIEGLSNVPTDLKALVTSQLVTIRNGQSMLQQLIIV